MHKNNIDVSLASHTPQVPHIGFPQSEPVIKVKIEKIKPNGAIDLATISANGCFHIKKVILVSDRPRYKKEANHAQGTCIYIILTVSPCW